MHYIRAARPAALLLLETMMKLASIPPLKQRAKKPLKALVLGSHALHFIKLAAEAGESEPVHSMAMDARYTVPDRGEIVFACVSAAMEYRALLLADIDRSNVVVYTYNQRDEHCLKYIGVHMQLVGAQSSTIPVVFVAAENSGVLLLDVAKEIGRICSDQFVTAYGPFLLKQCGDVRGIADVCFSSFETSVVSARYDKPPEKASSARTGTKDDDGDGDVEPSRSSSSSAPSTPRGHCQVQ
jgi:hypothetical protein